MRNLINAVNEAGGLGVYYWEPAWITVGDTTGLSEKAAAARYEANKSFGRKRAQAGHQATAVSMIQRMQENGMAVPLLTIRQCFIRMEQQQQVLRYGIT